MTSTPGWVAGFHQVLGPALRAGHGLGVPVDGEGGAVEAFPGAGLRGGVGAHRVATTQTTTAWLRLNYDFHLKLYDLAGRPHARRICANLLALTQPYSQENIEVLGGRETAMREHLEMVDAVQAGDAERLAELLRQHLSTARDQLTAARINPRGPADPDLTSLLGSRA